MPSCWDPRWTPGTESVDQQQGSNAGSPQVRTNLSKSAQNEQDNLPNLADLVCCPSVAVEESPMRPEGPDGIPDRGDPRRMPMAEAENADNHGVHPGASTGTHGEETRRGNTSKSPPGPGSGPHAARTLTLITPTQNDPPSTTGGTVSSSHYDCPSLNGPAGNATTKHRFPANQHVCNVTDGSTCTTKDKKHPLNPAIKKMKKWCFIQSVNNARVIWDPRAKPKGLLGGHLNIRSLTPKSDQIKQLLMESNLDYLFLSETWLHTNSPAAALIVPGYNIFRRDRPDDRWGGVIFYVRDTIHCTQIQFKDDQLECIGLDITLSPKMSFTVLGLYRPPDSKAIFFNQLNTILKECNLDKEVHLMGDFNLNWQDKHGRKALKQLTTKLNFAQMIKGPTRIISKSQTQIDLVFSNKPERITKTFNFVTGLSDHNLTLVSRKLSKNRFNLTTTKKQTYLRIPKAEQHNFEEAINGIDWSSILSGADVENDSHLFLSTIKSTMNSFLKETKSKRGQKSTLPWINDNIRKSMKERDQALKIALKYKKENDKRRFTSLRNKVTKELRQAKAALFIGIINEANGNSKIIWDNIKKMTGKDPKNSGKTLELKVNGCVTQNPQQIATAFNTYFVESVKTLTCTPPTDILHAITINETYPVFSMKEVSEPEVFRILSALKSSTAKDAFGLDSSFLKNHRESFMGPITKLVNTSIRDAVFPQAWKSAIITPIFKSGDATEVSNYRPVSILPVVSKVAEKCIAEQLINHLNNTPFSLHPMQFGFRANHSTETANCFFLESVKTKMDKQGVIGAVFLDLKKAFDTISHEVLTTKLSSFNFSPSAIKWMSSYLEGRTQRVRINGDTSPPLAYDVGVPQGSILGPLLFSLYINDLPSVCAGTTVQIQMYADDTVVYVHAKNKTQAAYKLNTVITRIVKWLSDNCLHLNTKKTVCMFFEKRTSATPDPDVFAAGQRLEVVKEFKYLGIILDSNLTFKKQAKKVTQIGKFNIANFKYIRNCLSMDTAKLYFNTLIMSHLTYCLTSWSQSCKTTLSPIQSVYKQALKVLDRKPTHHHHCNILQKHALLSWDNIIRLSDASLVYKIHHGLAPPPLSQFFTESRRFSRTVVEGDLIIPVKKSTFSESAFSVRAAITWNTIPSHIRCIDTHKSFKHTLKTWLLEHQTCNH